MPLLTSWQRHKNALNMVAVIIHFDLAESICTLDKLSEM